MRTTIDIDTPVLSDLKRLQKKEGKTLGALVSELLAAALAQHGARSRPRRPFSFVAQHMRARVDVEDREAVWKVLDDEDSRG